MSTFRLLRSLTLTISVFFLFFLAGCDDMAKSQMAKIEQQVAQDAVQQYEIAKRSGTAMDAYTHASLVSAAYLQAKDEANYKKWKQIEKAEGKRAGLPAEMLGE